MYSCTLSLTLALDWGGWSTMRPGRFTHREAIRYAVYRRLGGAPYQVWTRAEDLACTDRRSPNNKIMMMMVVEIMVTIMMMISEERF